MGPLLIRQASKGLPVDTAFKQIADANALFISRGDDSGTHKKELSIWESTGIDPQGQEWYVETGQG
ncbi:extracellular solute-binding protein, family 1, partial [Bifidobacterium animalis subsp. lactis HN019]